MRLIYWLAVFHKLTDLACFIFIEYASPPSPPSTPLWSEFLAVNPEVPGSIRGAMGLERGPLSLVSINE
jgi:hypothetical protein